ncbi:cation-transporting ATPase [Curtobacterium sp. Csp1]|uniref:cation-transporting ATPase n=1 Tax=unclassified Curtobacterium TaxID=257496 RepID=UPI001599F4DB|nr:MULTISPECIES: cation-transporting ATPase [unclassified Curtobacterium]QKS13578.1 cation-transporting ATPase [Curtobacterium sp. csp3]QKS20619.1 cation-transporting ATPase [Curtobacterium sp. Csp1]
MANLNRILGMASKVIDKQMQKQRGQGSPDAANPQSSGGTDWRDIVRTAADKLTGDDRQRPQQPQPQQPAPQQYGYQSQQQYGRQQHDQQQGGQPQQRGQADPDAVALAKYDYLLRTAPPERLEQVHHDAFARLTPEQRQQVRDRLNSELPPHEHLRDDSAGGMARAATRAEVSRPGLLKRALGGRGGSFAGGAAVGAGAMAVGGLAVAVAGGAVLSAAAGPVLAGAADHGVDFEGIAAGGEEFLGGLGEQAGGLGEQVSGLGEQASGLGEQASGLGEQASNLGGDFLGGLFDR